MHGAGVAQLVAQRTCNASVASSSLVSSSVKPLAELFSVEGFYAAFWGFNPGVNANFERGQVSGRTARCFYGALVNS